MANEITVSGSLSYSKNRARASLSGSLSATQTGDHYVQAVADIGTIEETVSKGDVVTIGWVAFRNNDSTHFIQIGGSTGQYALKLLPGEYMSMRWNTNAVLAKADTATCELEYLILEE